MNQNCCALCQASLLQKNGSLGTVIPFFRETQNKEFLSKLKQTTSPIVNDLITSMGINTSHLFSCRCEERRHFTYICGNCTRKIFNCYAMYQEIVTLIQEVEDACKQKETQSNDDVATKRDIIRSPSRLTPQKKKPRNTVTTRADVVSRKTLTFSSEASAIEDEISNLMNLPLHVTNEAEHQAVVKVL